VAHDEAPPSRIPRRELADAIIRSLDGPGWAKGEVTVGTARA